MLVTIDPFHLSLFSLIFFAESRLSASFGQAQSKPSWQGRWLHTGSLSTWYQMISTHAVRHLITRNRLEKCSILWVVFLPQVSRDNHAFGSADWSNEHDDSGSSNSYMPLFRARFRVSCTNGRVPRPHESQQTLHLRALVALGLVGLGIDDGHQPPGQHEVHEIWCKRLVNSPTCTGSGLTSNLKLCGRVHDSEYWSIHSEEWTVCLEKITSEDRLHDPMQGFNVFIMGTPCALMLYRCTNSINFTASTSKQYCMCVPRVV